ncbi:hypothetical protein LX32DRAFT_40663 [Colletotrichum zoysiae]|uniref:Uncharacterized protein n=1 Tax=Colletotrichum zoysiae TaxID=1216348 RepID=A0AAD9HBW3_9PEZI|nr:hypothetical protein LX32DRAFT_40663 [Colletotrichum zoysiae]
MTIGQTKPSNAAKLKNFFSLLSVLFRSLLDHPKKSLGRPKKKEKRKKRRRPSRLPYAKTKKMFPPPRRMPSPPPLPPCSLCSVKKNPARFSPLTPRPHRHGWRRRIWILGGEGVYSWPTSHAARPLVLVSNTTPPALLTPYMAKHHHICTRSTTSTCSKNRYSLRLLNISVKDEYVYISITSTWRI